MSYISQEQKAKIAPQVKQVCQKYGVKATLAIRDHRVLTLNIKSGAIDFIGNLNETCSKDHYQVSRGFTPITCGYDDVNVYHYKNHYSGAAKQFFDEVLPLLNEGNHDNSDLMTDYFDVGWYVNINVGKWNAPYQLVA